MSAPNEEVRIRWTGSARFDVAEAEWALQQARLFASAHAPDPEPRTGSRRAEIYTLHEWDRFAYIYFTKARAVVVRIHGAEVTP